MTMANNATAIDYSKLVEVFSRTHTELQRQAARAVDSSLVARNWLFGLYIVEYEQNGSDRARYGNRVLAALSEQLNKRGSVDISVSYLQICRKLFTCFREIQQTLSVELLSIDKTIDMPAFGDGKRGLVIVQTLSGSRTDADVCQLF